MRRLFWLFGSWNQKHHHVWLLISTHPASYDSGLGLVRVRQHGKFWLQPRTSRSPLSHQFHGWSRRPCLWVVPLERLRTSAEQADTSRSYKGRGVNTESKHTGEESPTFWKWPSVSEEVRFSLKSFSFLQREKSHRFRFCALGCFWPLSWKRKANVPGERTHSACRVAFGATLASQLCSFKLFRV